MKKKNKQNLNWNSVFSLFKIQLRIYQVCRKQLDMKDTNKSIAAKYPAVLDLVDLQTICPYNRDTTLADRNMFDIGLHRVHHNFSLVSHWHSFAYNQYTCLNPKTGQTLVFCSRYFVIHTCWFSGKWYFGFRAINCRKSSTNNSLNDCRTTIFFTFSIWACSFPRK